MTEWIEHPINLLTVATILGGLIFLLLAILALKRRRVIRMSANLLLSLLFFSLAVLFVVIYVGTRGYQAITHEAVAAMITAVPTGPQTFIARFEFENGRLASYHLSGDELYVDAHILKWKPVANWMGLHTAYELDRVAGRYRNLSEEQVKTRTVFSLSEKKPLDVFDLRRRYAMLGPLVDAEYGSATFVPADQQSEFELRVSTTGLLIRPRPRSASQGS